MRIKLMIWAEKYAPKNIDDVAGNPEAREEIKRWALDWQRGKNSGALLLYGPAGNGKTSAARAIAKTMQWEIVEMNAGDLRDKENVERVMGSASTSNTLSGGRKLILIDEADSMSRGDRGGNPAILEILKNARQPVIVTCNELYAKNMAGIRSECKKIEFKKVNVNTIRNVLQKIAEKEGSATDAQGCDTIAHNSSGDLRSAINDLQANISGSEDSRNRKQNIFESVRTVMKTTEYKKARTAKMESDVDHEMFGAWIEENIPNEYEDPEDSARAFDAISRADVFDGRIMRRQYWGLLRYAGDLVSAGVALAKKEKYHKFTMYAYPSRIRILGANKNERIKRKEICKKIGTVCSCSTTEAKKYLPLLAALGERDLLGVKELFGFEEEELAFLISATEAKVRKMLKSGAEDEEGTKKEKIEKMKKEKKSKEGKEEKDDVERKEQVKTAEKVEEKKNEDVGKVIEGKKVKGSKKIKAEDEAKPKEGEKKDGLAAKKIVTLDQFF